MVGLCRAWAFLMQGWPGGRGRREQALAFPLPLRPGLWGALRGTGVSVWWVQRQFPVLTTHPRSSIWKLGCVRALGSPSQGSLYPGDQPAVGRKCLFLVQGQLGTPCRRPPWPCPELPSGPSEQLSRRVPTGGMA